MKILCTRKEDELYYQGPFWIIAESVKDIHRGKFKLIGSKYECDYNGDYFKEGVSKSQRTHKKIWQTEYQIQFPDRDYMFYPRGRVSVYDGTAFIHLNSKCNIPSVIDSVISEYGIEKLEIEVDLNDTYQGSHYDFQLK